MGGQDSSEEASELTKGAATLNVHVSADTARALIAFLDLLYAWNESAGLTAIARRDAVRLHLLDSLALVPFLAGASRIADLGSGGGLPGIPIALAMPQARVTLVESKRRRCSFLKEVARRLGLATRVSVIEADAKVGLPALAGSQDTVVARAFVPPHELVSLAAPLLSPGGTLAIMSGGELPDLAPVATLHGLSVADAHSFALPAGAERRAVTLFHKP